uniref:Uncharacterized protein n=1 Tax=Palpitomonas bilix TaxID=652834 RepID=A0A7S3FYT2_9EUKA
MRRSTFRMHKIARFWSTNITMHASMPAFNRARTLPILDISIAVSAALLLRNCMTLDCNGIMKKCYEKAGVLLSLPANKRLSSSLEPRAPESYAFSGRLSIKRSGPL